MDRSFLSQPAVVAASRNFVCIRLTSYEDEAEMKFCRSLFIGRSGDAENTTFTILSPDGREPLVRPGRSAKQVYANAQAMADGMAKIAGQYPTPSSVTDPAPLPVTLDARLGLDVAASDGLPLVVIIAKDPAQRSALEAKVASAAWMKGIIGRFTYASVEKFEDIPNLSGGSRAEGVLVVEPDAFGQKGKVLIQIAADATSDQINNMLHQAAKGPIKTAKNSREHRALGIKQGAFWEPKLPVTDREEANARARTKSAIEKQNP